MASCCSQLYISRGSMDSFSLVSDAAYISASLARITRALFEICLRRGWCEMSLFMLEYCKAVDRQVWPHQHPLRQFDKDLSAEVLRKLEERGADLDRLFEMEEKDIGALIRYVPGGRLVKQNLGYFPSLQLSATVSPITRTVLKVDLVITPVFVWKDRFHGTAQRWWILVEVPNHFIWVRSEMNGIKECPERTPILQDSENDHIYHSELFTLTKRMARGEPYKLSFTVPIFEPHPPQYYIHAISDSWLHAESFYTITFHNLPLPEARTSHTELLDLKPLPVSSLGSSAYEALYKFSHFNPIQTQTFHVLYHTDNNVLLGAPTGSGKTISAELAMFRLFNTHPDMKVIYIAPLKAIVRERMSDWQKRLVSQLGKKMVEMTGDFTPDLTALMSANIIISTPEKWDGISRNWHTRSYVTKVGLMILDEIHLLGADRGPILEGFDSCGPPTYNMFEEFDLARERAVRFIGLSTALANAGDLADWLGVEEIGLFNFKPSVRPVPLEVHIQASEFGGYPGKYYCPRMNSMNKPAYAAICTHSPAKPVLIFVSSRRQTRLTALDLIQFAASDEQSRQFLSLPEESLQMVLSQVSDQNLRHTLQFGIGLHHAGLNDKDRSLVEELFGNNKIQAYFYIGLYQHIGLGCESSSSSGDHQGDVVVEGGTEYYDGKAKRYVDFPITDILQMMGRAGRPQFDQHGKAVILVHEPKKSFYKKFLYEPFPVESSLREHLHDHINAEIISGTICHKQDAVHYLTWTYLFRRLLRPEEGGTWSSSAKQQRAEWQRVRWNQQLRPGHYSAKCSRSGGHRGNGCGQRRQTVVGGSRWRLVVVDHSGFNMVNPAYYGLENAESEFINSYLSSLVQNTFEDLEDSGCIKMDEDRVEPMMLGSIASQYYLSYMTVSMFGSNIGPDTSLEVFLHILSAASEFDELPVRHNEDHCKKERMEEIESVAIAMWYWKEVSSQVQRPLQRHPDTKYAEVGIIYSKFHLRPSSISNYSEIKADSSSESSILDEKYNEALSVKVKYPVDKNRLDDPHIKATLLFQAHFSQLELPISDYVTDLKSVLDQSIRIIQAMIDICANSGWLSSSIACMRLLQMVMQGLWYEKDSSLWMLPCMNTDLLSSLSQRGISSVQELLDIPKTALQTVTANFPASRLYQDLQHFPHIKMKLKVQRRDTDGERSHTLNIRLEKINSRRHSSRAFVPRFPKIKEEQWWLVLGNTSTSELYALKRVSFSDHLVTSMKLPQTPASLQGIKLILVSDCYIGFEQEHSIDNLDVC
ncbi:unnamed protein product [Sphenostylis stenocarpa]|uniref:Helicase ATP-binding domain-containing protein n=1 Tax=Sphenostylis stenocarpa TaxID=92480 RepID=A0AA86T7H0_9FABA|nr:unnamed protein product [Sphenostylis stenocarpa]